jgi:hypothetical protein
VTSLVQAAAAFMETTDPRGAGDGEVEHIDVGDDWPEDE